MTDKYVIVCLGLVGKAIQNTPPPIGKFLETYEPEAFDGFGATSWTDDENDAMHFTDAFTAFQCYRAVPVNRPLRDDGKRNMPLTAYTVAVQKVGDGGHQ